MIRFLVFFIFTISLGESGELRAAPRWNAEQQRIQKLVISEARRYGLDPALALAVAHTESHFQADALSHSGARGVMQIMPDTAMGEYGIHPDLLWQPEINIRLGVHFLNRLLQQYKGVRRYALSYYNGGSRVGIWPRVKVIPTTRSYVKLVEKRQRFYTRQLQKDLY